MNRKKWFSLALSMVLTAGMIPAVTGSVSAETSYESVAAAEAESTDPAGRFNDVDPQEWYHDGISYVLDKGIMNGTGETSFEPGSVTTRAMIVTMLWRMEGQPSAADAGFTDLESGSWYEAAVNWAAAGQIINGYEGKLFGPEDSVTREQLAAILYRYEQFKNRVDQDLLDTDLLNFDDAGLVSSWAVDAMKWAVGGQLIQGRTAVTLSPAGSATRAEVATILMRYDGQKRSNSGKLWQYSYAGVEHPYLEAVSEWLVKYDEENLEIRDGMIPCITSIEIDNEDESDIKMWGIFDIYNYSLSDGTLTEENGKRLLGLFRLSQAEDGCCTVKDTSFVEEGDVQAIDALCEGHELALDGLKHPKVTEETRRWYISEFVRKAGLEAAQYQPAGSAPLPVSYETQPSPDWVASLPEAQETDRLIVVDVTIGSNAVLTMHEKNEEGVWQQTLDEAAFIGKNGLGKTKEGDLKTPVGSFGFNAALGINEDPGCVLDYTRVDGSHYWNGDSNSDRYNQLVSTDDYTDFSIDDSEHIVDYPNAYKYLLNTTYNEEGTPGKGSAIFLHCYREQRTYTGGCISIPLEKMEYVMKQIRKDSRILIRKQPEM